MIEFCGTHTLDRSHQSAPAADRGDLRFDHPADEIRAFSRDSFRRVGVAIQQTPDASSAMTFVRSGDATEASNSIDLSSL